MKAILYLAALLVVVSDSPQCTQDASAVLSQMTAVGLQSLNSLHDYVWIVDEHSLIRDEKGKIARNAWRQQTIVANGQMYSRLLRPGEEPAIPESEADLLSGYQVAPALYGHCGNIPCGSYPWAFSQLINMPSKWEVRQVRQSNLGEAPALVVDLRAKRRYRSALAPITGTAWIDPGSCRLLRLTVVSANPDGDDHQEETFEFGNIKGNWLPIKRESHSSGKGRVSESTEEYTYLKFGSSVRLRP